MDTYNKFGNLITNHRFVFQVDIPNAKPTPEAKPDSIESLGKGFTDEDFDKLASDQVQEEKEKGEKAKAKTKSDVVDIEQYLAPKGSTKRPIKMEQMAVNVDPETGEVVHLAEQINVTGKPAELTPKQQKILDKITKKLDALSPEKRAKKLDKYAKSWKNVRIAAEAYKAQLSGTMMAKAEKAPEAEGDRLVQLAKQAEKAGLKLNESELAMTKQTYDVLMSYKKELDTYLGKFGTSQKLLDTLVATNTKLVEAGDKEGFQKLNVIVNGLAMQFEYGEGPVAKEENWKDVQRAMAQDLQKAIEEARV